MCTMRMDGISQFIMYGTGSHCAHSVMALRFDGELYMSKAQMVGIGQLEGFKEIDGVNGSNMQKRPIIM